MEYMNYEKDFLSNVIVRADFLSPNALAGQTELPEAIIKLCKDKCPTPVVSEIQNQEIAFNPVGISITQAPTIMKEWHFVNSEKTLQITITPNCLLVQNANSYLGYDVIGDLFVKIFNELIKEFPELQVIRLGLRYVNNINLNAQSENNDSLVDFLSKYFETDLVKGLSVSVDEKQITRQLSNIEIKYEDCSLIFRWGVFNSNYPTPIKNKEFLLDYDVYATGALDVTSIEETLNTFHDKASEWFEKSITEEFRNILGVISDAE